MEYPKLVREVMVFVAEKTGYPLESIGPDTMLAYDLGLTEKGFLNGPFLGAFAERFSVDWESIRAFDWMKQYEKAEGDLVLPVWLKLLLFLLWPFSGSILTWWLMRAERKRMKWPMWAERKRMKKLKKDPNVVRVQDLVEAAAAKHWMKKNTR